MCCPRSNPFEHLLFDPIRLIHVKPVVHSLRQSIQSEIFGLGLLMITEAEFVISTVKLSALSKRLFKSSARLSGSGLAPLQSSGRETNTLTSFAFSAKHVEKSELGQLGESEMRCRRPRYYRNHSNFLNLLIVRWSEKRNTS